jgi:DNA-binding response OmpR family regulator
MAAEPLVRNAGRTEILHVLVVDANTTARTHVQAALGEGFNVHCVASAGEAITAMESRLPDLVVSEVDLPSESGLSLCEYVRSRPDSMSLPIMLLTSRDSIQDKVAGFQAGADDYVVKPLDPRLFFARVRLLCRIKGLEHRHTAEV